MGTENPLFFGEWNLSNVSQFFVDENIHVSNFFILVDENTELLCLPKFIDDSKLSIILIRTRSGESNKNFQTLSLIWQRLLDSEADRNSVLINLGGGVISDLGAFAASTYKRGIRFVNVPTTLLAQTDAALGGKNGIDFGGLKNSVGSFRWPDAVFIDVQFLNSLPYEELVSGLAESLKHGLIADEKLWQSFKKLDLNKAISEKLIKQSIQIKTRICEADPFEKNERKKLNFGHTFAHAFESCFLEAGSGISHGEAVAAGMICESYISSKITGLPIRELIEITETITKFYPKLPLQNITFPALMTFMLNDKKNAGSINFTLLTKIGESSINQSADEHLIKESIQYYLKHI